MDGWHKLLIVGCGRGATHYVTQVLRKCGADFAHETAGYKDGMASWFMPPDDPSIDQLWKCGQFKPCRVMEFRTVAHQVRHPLAVIRSWMSMPASRAQIEFIERHTTCSSRLSRLSFAMRYWLEWSLMCDTHSCYSYRVEQISKSMPQLAKKADVPFFEEAIWNTAPTNTTPNPARAVSWADLSECDAGLTKEIKDLASLYGYNGRCLHG